MAKVTQQALSVARRRRAVRGAQISGNMLIVSACESKHENYEPSFQGAFGRDICNDADACVGQDMKMTVNIMASEGKKKASCEELVFFEMSYSSSSY